MTFDIPVTVQLRRVRLAMLVGRCAYIACRIVTLTPDESAAVAVRIASRIIRRDIRLGRVGVS